MRPLVAHCHLGLGKLYRRTGKREQAREHLDTATTMYREMDMRFWLDRRRRNMEPARDLSAVRLRESSRDGVLRALRNQAGVPVPSCGFANPEGFAFCGKCGARVTGCPRQLSRFLGLRLTALVHAQAPRREDPDLQGRTRRRAQAGHGALRDLKGSMELLAERDPEEAEAPRTRCSSADEAVHRYEGTINQFIGDGFMALFGAPIATRTTRCAPATPCAADAGGE